MVATVATAHPIRARNPFESLLSLAVRLGGPVRVDVTSARVLEYSYRTRTREP